jgi:hypothetical protein
MNAMAKSEGWGFTRETHPTAMKFALPAKAEPTSTIGIGYKKAALLSILILSIVGPSFILVYQLAKFA